MNCNEGTSQEDADKRLVVAVTTRAYRGALLLLWCGQLSLLSAQLHFSLLDITREWLREIEALSSVAPELGSACGRFEAHDAMDVKPEAAIPHAAVSTIVDALQILHVCIYGMVFHCNGAIF